MGYTKGMIQYRHDILASKGNKEGEFFQDLLNVLNDYPEKIWGYEEFGKDGVIVIGGDLERIEREEVKRRLPHFKLILFLKGLDKYTFYKDTSLVQRVMMYGGSLPDWRWTLIAGEWKEHFQECVNEAEVMKLMGVEYYNPFKE